MLTGTDGSTVGLGLPGDVLEYAVKTLETGVSSRLSDGIRRKLVALNDNWRPDGLANAAAAGGVPGVVPGSAANLC